MLYTINDLYEVFREKEATDECLFTHIQALPASYESAAEKTTDSGKFLYTQLHTGEK